MFFNIKLSILAACLSAAAALGLEKLPLGPLTEGKVEQGRITASAGKLELIRGKARTGNKALRLLGGEEKSLSYSFDKTIEKDADFAFWMQRWSSRGPYKVSIKAQDEQGKLTLLESITNQAVGSYNKQCKVKLPKGTRAVIITATTAQNAGLLLDDFVLYVGPMLVKNVSVENPGMQPIMKRASVNPVVRLKFSTEGNQGVGIKDMRLKLSPAKSVAAVSLRVGDAQANDFASDGLIFTARPDENGVLVIQGDKMRELPSGESTLWLDVTASKSAEVGSEITISDIEIRTAKKSFKQKEDISQPIGFLVARGGEDVKVFDGSARACKHFRIPGMITSTTGKLIACFDTRYHHYGDLCADIDVATSSSNDGGQTWSPLEVSMDIGKGVANGCGDPCILQDAKGRIWIQALGTHFSGGSFHFSGGSSLFKSATGNDPKTTAQWYMTYSDDDGKTWSKDLVNPTKQIKKDEWNCILAGPGTGITTSKGVIVFPAQIWQTGEKLNCRSTICYSTDNGKNWVYGTGLPRRTSECVLVELEDGSLMLNARDEERSGKRAVYITRDLGKTWIAHESNLKALQEPVCQASLIKIDSKKYGKLLLFSNPKNGSRSLMTIRFSKDEGKTWSNGYLYDTRRSAGYSSLSMIDEDTIGVLYESSTHNDGVNLLGIAFQRIPLKDIIDAK